MHATTIFNVSADKQRRTERKLWCDAFKPTVLFSMHSVCVLFSPLSISLRAAGVFRGVIRRRWDGGDKFFKVHHISEKGVLRSGAFWVNWAGSVRSQLPRDRGVVYTANVNLTARSQWHQTKCCMCSKYVRSKTHYEISHYNVCTDALLHCWWWWCCSKMSM